MSASPASRNRVQIEHQTENDISLITVTGRLMLGPESAQLEALVKSLAGAGVRKVLFDFTGLDHIDSTGIGRCISALNAVMQVGGKLVITGASGQVRDSFRVTQLDRVFKFIDDPAEARAALA